MKSITLPILGIALAMTFTACDKEQAALEEQDFGEETDVTISGRTQTNDSIVLKYRDRTELIDTVIYNKSFSINIVAYKFFDDNVFQMKTISPDSCFFYATDGSREVFEEFQTQVVGSTINLGIQLSQLE